MREIKLRAYDKEAGEFIYSHKAYDDVFFEFKDGTLKAFRICEKDYGPPEERVYSEELEPPEMFTGLRDCHGLTDIYEGDILGLEHFLPWVVVWHKAGFYFYNKGNPERLYPLEDITAREVIGSIYEKPELLT